MMWTLGSPVWQETDDLLRSSLGAEPVLITIVLANVSELGTATDKHMSSLVGVAPLNRNSGTLHGRNGGCGADAHRSGQRGPGLPSW